VINAHDLGHFERMSRVLQGETARAERLIASVL
jgi:hypothetical protein